MPDLRPFSSPPDDPEGTIQRVLGRHLEPFLDRVATDADVRVPGFVVDALRRTTTCGDFTRGFLRLRCVDCKSDRIVPFRCRTSIWPTCAGRGMAERAAWLVGQRLVW